MAETTRHGPGSLVGQTFYDVDGLGAWQRIAIVPGELRSAGAAREVLVVETAASAGRDLLCLGETVDGWPRHPLFVQRDAPLCRWRGLGPGWIRQQRAGDP